MRMRSLGLAGVIGLALAWGYPAGQSGAQFTINRAEIDERTRLNVARPLIEFDHLVKYRIEGVERLARSTYLFGECADFAAYRRRLEVIADGISDDEVREWNEPYMGNDNVRDRLEALAQAALASLPENCDPDPFIRSQLERDRHANESGDGDAH